MNHAFGQRWKGFVVSGLLLACVPNEDLGVVEVSVVAGVSLAGSAALLETP
jgi:hypothetical protein